MASKGGVKNKAPSARQITAEQLLREAWERKEVGGVGAPVQRITDQQELMEYRQSRRKDFEDRLRMNRTAAGTWLKYAKWEASQSEFERARSVYERAIDVDYRNPSIWLSYAEFEMKNRFVNHARNIWDRAVALLPRVDQLWYKYAYMEEMLGNVPNARLVYTRWMRWMPAETAWMQFVRFELRRGEVSRARDIFENFLQMNPSATAYVRLAKFEEKSCRDLTRARAAFERASEDLPQTELKAPFFISFAKFEERCREFDRARAIYRYALSQQIPGIQDAYTTFEKQHGERQQLEVVLLDKRRREYQSQIAADTLDYDAWFDLLRLEEAAGNHEDIRETYERAIASVPPGTDKRNWRRYIYLWIDYAVWEELESKNLNRAAEIYSAALDLIPGKHAQFSFSKLWIMASDLQVRRRDISYARKILGRALALAPKEKIFRHYISMELSLGDVGRCRKILAKWVEVDPTSTTAWNEFALFEASLEEPDRARSIFDLALDQPELDVAEVLWKSYIDFEVGRQEYEKVRALYERLLGKSRHMKVWTSYALFEQTIAQEKDKTRSIYNRGVRDLKQGMIEDPSIRPDRAALIFAWIEFEEKEVEETSDNSTHLQEARKLAPRLAKRKRALRDNSGTALDWEEYSEFVFPEEEADKPKLNLLQAAQAWKKSQAGGL